MANTLGILWMSPGNSYFKKGKINEIITKYAQEYDILQILSPASLAKHTYQAMGYDETKARRKAQQNTNRLLNHAQRTIDKHGLENTYIIRWQEEIAEHRQYKHAHNYIMQLYKNNGEFRRDARQTTHNVLESKTGKNVDSEQVDEAIIYLLAELAYVWGASQIHKTKTATYIYHHTWPILDKLIDGTYTGFESKDLQFRFNNL